MKEEEEADENRDKCRLFYLWFTITIEMNVEFKRKLIINALLIFSLHFNDFSVD